MREELNDLESFVEDDGGDTELMRVADKSRTGFIMIPNVVVEWPGMTHTAFRLYVWYKRTAGEGGTCWRSLSSAAEQCGMRRQSVVDSRELLIRMGLITVKRERAKNSNERVHVRIVDVWDQNVDYMSKKESPSSVVRSGYAGGYVPATRGVRSGYSSKNQGIKNTLSPNGDGTSGLLTPAVEKTPTRLAAEKLCQALLDKGILEKGEKPNLGVWSRQFDEHIRKHNIVVEEFVDLLEDYCRHIGEEYAPVAESASGFCKKYKAIKRARIRNWYQGGNGKCHPDEDEKEDEWIYCGYDHATWKRLSAKWKQLNPMSAFEPMRNELEIVERIIRGELPESAGKREIKTGPFDDDDF